MMPLRRTLGLLELFSIAFGAIIGWGVFTLTADWFEMSGPWGTFIAAYIGMLMILPIASSYVLLIPYIPEAGGEYKWAYKSLGGIHGFITGWWLYVSYVSIALLNATAFPIWLRILAPNLVEWGYLYTVGRFKVYLGYILLSTLILTIFFILNYVGVRSMGIAQTIMSLLLVIGGFSYIALCLVRGNITNSWNPTPWSIKNGALGGILAWLAIAPWAYVGFDTVPQAMEETKINPRKAFVAMFTAILIGAIFYAFITLSTAFVKPWTLFLGTWLATATAIKEVAGEIGVAIVLTSALMGILTGINGFMYAATRLLFAMSRDELLPGTLSDIHEKFGTPYKAVLLTYILSLIGPLFGREALSWFVNVASFGTALAYLYVGLSTFKQYKNIALNNNKHEHYVKTVGLLSSIISFFFLALLIYQLWLNYYFTSFIAIAVYTFLGLLLYYARSKRVGGEKNE
jgi:amino acid transporter